MRRAFTIVELLVVVTIIVVLLALLAPAMDQAVYQAELATCGAQKDVVAGAVLTYAAENKRVYPRRPWVDQGIGERAVTLNWNDPHTDDLDSRSLLRPYMKLNHSLNCPLVKPIAIDVPDARERTIILSTFGLWFGYGYRGFDRMKRIGDRFSYAEAGGPTQRFNVVAGTWDGHYFDRQEDYASHPDHDGKSQNTPVENVPSLVAAYPASFSFWFSRGGAQGRRGLIDANYAFDDGSVRRYNAVKWAMPDPDNDERMVNMQARHTLNNTNWRVQLPKR